MWPDAASLGCQQRQRLINAHLSMTPRVRQAEAEALRERVETKELLHHALEARVSHLADALDSAVRA